MTELKLAEKIDADPAEKLERAKEWAENPPNPLKGVSNERLLGEVRARFPNLLLSARDGKGGVYQHFQGDYSYLAGEAMWLGELVKADRIGAIAKRQRSAIQVPVPIPGKPKRP